jgi:hypothetical protein
MMHPMPCPEKDVDPNDWRVVDARQKFQVLPTDFNVI